MALNISKITRKKYKEARRLLELLLHQKLNPKDHKRIEKIFLSLKKDNENLDSREDAESIIRKVHTFIEESQHHIKIMSILR